MLSELMQTVEKEVIIGTATVTTGNFKKADRGDRAV
jgi:hypothetical protein